MYCTLSYDNSFLTSQKIQNECKGHNVAHRLYEGICCFQYVMQFHITYRNVISYMSIRRVQPALCQFSQSWQTPSSSACRPLILASPKGGSKCGQHVHKFVYTPQESMAFTVTIFMKQSLNQWSFLDILYWILSKLDRPCTKMCALLGYALGKKKMSNEHGCHDYWL